MEIFKRAILTLSLILGCTTLAEARQPSPPFVVKLISKPYALVAGGKHTFTVEIKNKSNSAITLSTLYGFSWGLSWTSPDGSGYGSFSGAGSKLIVGTYLNPETGETTCKYLHYEKGDFITIPAHGSKRFEVVIDVPEDCDAALADVTIGYESKYDGSEVGIKAWTGKGKTLNLRLPVRRGNV